MVEFIWFKSKIRKQMEKMPQLWTHVGILTRLVWDSINVGEIHSWNHNGKKWQKLDRPKNPDHSKNKKRYYPERKLNQKKSQNSYLLRTKDFIILKNIIYSIKYLRFFLSFLWQRQDWARQDYTTRRINPQTVIEDWWMSKICQNFSLFSNHTTICCLLANYLLPSFKESLCIPPLLLSGGVQANIRFDYFISSILIRCQNHLNHLYSTRWSIFFYCFHSSSKFFISDFSYFRYFCLLRKKFGLTAGNLCLKLLAS